MNDDFVAPLPPREPLDLRRLLPPIYEIEVKLIEKAIDAIHEIASNCDGVDADECARHLAEIAQAVLLRSSAKA